MKEASQELGQVVMELPKEEIQLVGLVLVQVEELELELGQELETVVEEWMVLLCSEYYFKLDSLHC